MVDEQVLQQHAELRGVPADLGEKVVGDLCVWSTAALLPLEEARKVLESWNASRPEIEPLLDYLEGYGARRV